MTNSAFFERAPSKFGHARLKNCLRGNCLPENMLDMTAKLHAELQFSVDGMTVNGGGKGVVSLPWIGGQ